MARPRLPKRRLHPIGPANRGLPVSVLWNSCPKKCANWNIEIGYWEPPFFHCPLNGDLKTPYNLVSLCFRLFPEKCKASRQKAATKCHSDCWNLISRRLSGMARPLFIALRQWRFGAFQDTANKVIRRRIRVEGESLKRTWRLNTIFAQFLSGTVMEFLEKEDNKKVPPKHSSRKRMPHVYTCTNFYNVWDSAKTSNILSHRVPPYFNKSRFSCSSTDLAMIASVTSHWFGSSGFRSYKYWASGNCLGRKGCF